MFKKINNKEDTNEVKKYYNTHYFSVLYNVL